MFKLASLVSTKLKPICTVWELKLKCNSKCIHCGSSAEEKWSDELSNEEAFILVRELKGCGFKGVALIRNLITHMIPEQDTLQLD